MSDGKHTPSATLIQARRAYDAYCLAMHGFDPDEWTKPWMPWDQLHAEEQRAWFEVVDEVTAAFADCLRGDATHG